MNRRQMRRRLRAGAELGDQTSAVMLEFLERDGERRRAQRAEVRSEIDADGFRSANKFERGIRVQGGNTVRLKGREGEWFVVSRQGVRFDEMVVCPAEQARAVRGKLRTNRMGLREAKYLDETTTVKTSTITAVKMSKSLR